MNIEWDKNKRLSNIKKHGVDFIDAALIFENRVIESIDSREDYQETRWQALGCVEDDCFLVAYTWRGDVRRIISAWKVNEDGKQRYEKILSGRT